MIYTFDVVNSGTMDAKIGTLNFGSLICNGAALNPADKFNDETLVCNNINHQLTYADESSLQPNDTILSGETKSMKLKVSYSGALPTSSVRITGLDISIIYIQN